MKLSIETKVASVVAAGFLAVTIGVVTQANGAARTGEPDKHRLTNNPNVNAYMIQQRYDASLLNRTGSRTSPFKLSLGKNVDGARGVSDL
jgi:hypothetical protein